MNIRDTIEYNEMGYRIVRCPVCNHETLDNHWVCENCGWEYDGLHESTEFSTTNRMTLSEAIIKYNQKESIDD